MFNAIKNLFNRKPAIQFDANEQLARDIVENYAVQLYGKTAKVFFKPEMNRTVRFDIEYSEDGFSTKKGIQGLYRIRRGNNVNSFRPVSGGNLLSLNKGPDSFDQIHFGRITVGFESDTGRDICNFSVAAA